MKKLTQQDLQVAVATTKTIVSFYLRFISSVDEQEEVKNKINAIVGFHDPIDPTKPKQGSIISYMGNFDSLDQNKAFDALIMYLALSETVLRKAKGTSAVLRNLFFQKLSESSSQDFTDTTDINFIIEILEKTINVLENSQKMQALYDAAIAPPTSV